MDAPERRSAPGPQRAVYGIAVAAELVGMGPQTLRLYEARGLLHPERSDGGTRRYSANDLDRLRRIGTLVGEGLNLVGVAMVLDLEAQNALLRAQRSTSDIGRPRGKRNQPVDFPPTPMEL